MKITPVFALFFLVTTIVFFPAGLYARGGGGSSGGGSSGGGSSSGGSSSYHSSGSSGSSGSSSSSGYSGDSYSTHYHDYYHTNNYYRDNHYRDGYYSGSGGGYYSNNSSGAAIIVVIFVLILAGLIVVSIFSTRKPSALQKNYSNIITVQSPPDEELDLINPRIMIESKASHTNQLLDRIARIDPQWEPQKLADYAKDVFLLLQQCWQKRDYSLIRNYMMPSLYDEHCIQIEGMVHNHEINVMENLSVDAVDIINVRYAANPIDRQFTAIITATARDYYVDDRTNKEIRGDITPTTFQEFWTFYFQNDIFLLGLIEQTKESSVMKEENFFEQVSVQQTQNAADGNAAVVNELWAEKESLTTETRTEALLKKLAGTDKLWDARSMIEFARGIFVKLYLGKEAGNFSPDLLLNCFPQVAQYLTEAADDWKQKGQSFEYRNFCIRKAEIILVRNFRDNSKDEFVVRFSAHAKRILKSGGNTQKQDEYIKPFDEFWTFGRLDDVWKLKEIVPAKRGEKFDFQANFDEESAIHQLECRYSNKSSAKTPP